MFNPYQNLFQMLANPLYLLNVAGNQQQQIHQIEQPSHTLWPMSQSASNYPQQASCQYSSQEVPSPNLQSFLLLSSLLMQSQHIPSQSVQSNHLSIPLSQESQPSLNSLPVKQFDLNEPQTKREDISKKALFNPILKKVEQPSTTELAIEEEGNTQLNDFSKTKQLENKLKYYKCTFKDCDKVFPKECNLKDHIRTHTGEKPYQCSFNGCGKSFSQHGNLKKHEKVHVGDKKFFCDHPNCGKKFSASYNLKIHYRCHTGERPYKCSFKNCNRSFYDKGNLKYHEKTMHMAESIAYPYSCEHMGCNAKFQTKKEKLIHHNEMEPDCLTERKELIKLIQRYKVLLKYIVKENNIDESQNEVLINLKSVYEEIEGKLIDVEYFKQLLGESFQDECSYVENNKDEEKETDQASSKNE